MVFTSDPAEIKRVYAARRRAARRRQLGLPGAVRRPALDPRARRRGAPARAQADAAAVPRRGARALARDDGERGRGGARRWEPGRPLRTLERMQAVALEVILRVVFGGGDPQLRDAIRRALQVPMPMLLAMSLWRDQARRVRRLPAPRAGGSTRCSTSGSTATTATARCSPCSRPPAPRASSCATSSPRCSPPATRRPPARSAGRSSGSRAIPRCSPASARATRPTSTPRQGGPARAAGAGDHAAPGRRQLRARRLDAAAGVHVTPCIYLAHRRADVWEDPTAFRPERFLDGAPEPYTFIPFGGGMRRCVGAAFASLEMKEVLRAVARPVRAAAGGRAAASAMRRRSITMTPSRGGYVVPHSPRHADVLPPQPADRQLPDLQPRAAG